mmetsp:Transcript_929/g.3489  ORF Transcript_929/g.3489 Transcript_929/m.3489 type:complete len:237 (-) Transcript_929:1746-2456(-)
MLTWPVPAIAPRGKLGGCGCAFLQESSPDTRGRIPSIICKRGPGGSISHTRSSWSLGLMPCKCCSASSAHGSLTSGAYIKLSICRVPAPAPPSPSTCPVAKLRDFLNSFSWEPGTGGIESIDDNVFSANMPSSPCIVSSPPSSEVMVSRDERDGPAPPGPASPRIAAAAASGLTSLGASSWISEICSAEQPGALPVRSLLTKLWADICLFCITDIADSSFSPRLSKLIVNNSRRVG